MVSPVAGNNISSELFTDSKPITSEQIIPVYIKYRRAKSIAYVGMLYDALVLFNAKHLKETKNRAHITAIFKEARFAILTKKDGEFISLKIHRHTEEDIIPSTRIRELLFKEGKGEEKWMLPQSFKEPPKNFIEFFEKSEYENYKKFYLGKVEVFPQPIEVEASAAAKGEPQNPPSKANKLFKFFKNPFPKTSN
ncbi:hypothetical protein [Parachlamydia sp. AcF125]|uniref:hypothetical protein n=1 Tax=Parachlamydia sp. AcF125 TaxID=2795736 RepID=UPI001BC9B1DC|nr:hypothetical protein [Parachlamydia sp. AcF125]MBS4167957.1 hypothetical protein [Parachlamydia sp. AcF125]